MIYLSGHVRPQLVHPMLGFMNTPRMGNLLPDGVPWAADNGRFSAPSKYSDEGYIKWLVKQPIETCLFAVAPDVFGDHAATIGLSRPMFRRVRDAGYRVAFVAQNGWSEHTTPWDEFDALFVGGDNAFKLSTSAIQVAKRRGKYVHMGRVNSFRRLRLAAALGCDSADGTFLKFGPTTNEPRLLCWLEALSANPMLKFL